MSAAATGYESSATARLPVLVGLAALALVVAARVPLEVAVFGVLVFGVPHVALEVRYVYGRFGAGIDRWVIVALQVVLVAVVANRVLVSGRPARVAETLLLGALLIVALVAGRPDPRRRLAAVVVGAAVAGALWLALAGLDSWFLVQAHLHNILPLAFLWEWSTTALPAAVGRRWRAVLVALFVGVPTLVLSGLLDPLLAGAGGTFAVTAEADAATRASSTIVPAGWPPLWGPRLLAAFAFAQLLHYAVWCWFLPRSAAGREATARLEGTLAGPAIRGWRYAGAVAAVAGIVALVAWADLAQGRATYTSLAAYHALLEYPLLVLLARGIDAAADEPLVCNLSCR